MRFKNVCVEWFGLVCCLLWSVGLGLVFVVLPVFLYLLTKLEVSVVMCVKTCPLVLLAQAWLVRWPKGSVNWELWVAPGTGEEGALCQPRWAGPVQLRSALR